MHGADHMPGLFSLEDYPKEAVRRGWEGTVIVDVAISAKGQVIACRVAQSSGHDVLDQKTCEIMKKRARFIPARDANGKPVGDVARVPPIIWKLR